MVVIHIVHKMIIVKVLKLMKNSYNILKVNFVLLIVVQTIQLKMIQTKHALIHVMEVKDMLKMAYVYNNVQKEDLLLICNKHYILVLVIVENQIHLNMEIHYLIHNNVLKIVIQQLINIHKILYVQNNVQETMQNHMNKKVVNVVQLVHL